MVTALNAAAHSFPVSLDPAVEVEGLSYAYGRRTVLRGVEFTVARGEIFGLLGPNGSGKTTVFRILATLLPAMRGSTRVFGLDAARHSRTIRWRTGVVFQSSGLDGKLTVVENLRHQGHLYALHGRRLRERIGEMLDRFGFRDRADDLVETLSGGLRRRVELAKGLLHHPDLLLLDEPSAGLDPGARRDLWDYLGELRREDGVTILLTTHILDEAEGCDRLGILDGGEIVALGTPDGLKEEIGGDVITVETPVPQKLRDRIRERLGGEPTVLNGTVRIHRQRGGAFIAELMEAFTAEIDAVTLGKPTLEDVFIQRTGHQFWENREPTER